MAIHIHAGTYPVKHTIDTTQIYNSSQLVTKKSGMMIQPNKAIVGANAFAHGIRRLKTESGIHQDGYLKNRSTYEIMSPQLIGLPDKQLVLGKHSGRNAFNTRINSIIANTIYAEPMASNPAAYESLFTAFKKLADCRKTGVNDDDLFALLDAELSLITGVQIYMFKSLTVISGSGILSTATLTITDVSKQAQNREALNKEAQNMEALNKEAQNMEAQNREALNKETQNMETQNKEAPNKETQNKEGQTQNNDAQHEDYELTDAATGHGPVHAIFNAINRLVGFKNVLASYNVSSVSGGSDSLGLVTVRLRPSSSTRSPSQPVLEDDEADMDGPVCTGRGTDEDILIASAKAYINAVNKMIGRRD
jgi:2-isopropylmalate synthase